MARIELQDVRKSYAGQEVIHGVSIDIANGEFVVIVGPSGCGKSTLLRMVAGLEEITSGTIRIGDRVVNDLEPPARNIAMVFQNYALYPHMTVRDNMAYGLKIAGMSRADIDARVARAAAMLELDPYLDRKPRALSGGQRQRVAMGRALVREPAAFLLDEPLSNLDAKLRVQMRLQIKDLHQRTGQTTLYVTHDQVEAMTLADRLVVMDRGVAQQVATPYEVYTAPANEFVAGFIGSPAMNIIDARSDGGMLVLPGGHRVTVGASPPDGDLRLGLRPEDIETVPAGPDAFPVVLRSIEWLGADAYGYGLIDNSDTQLTVRMPGNALMARGDRVHISLSRSRMHFFSKADGRRL